MGQILDAYRFVKVAQEIIDELDAVVPIPQNRSGVVFEHRPAVEVVKKRYRNKYGKTLKSANRVSKAAFKKGYLTRRINYDPNGAKIDGVSEVASLTVTPNGYELTEKTLGFIPLGLFVTWWGTFGAFISGFVVGILIPVITFLVKRLLSRY